MGRVKIIIVLLLAFNSCTEKNGGVSVPVVPVANFDYSIEGDCGSPVVEFAFVNKSLFANQFFWDFGDGTTSTVTNPKKVYQKAGSYQVKLIASSTETNDALTKDVSVSRNSDGRGPVAGLTYSRLSANSLSYSFTMTGVGAIKYSLDFGDGSPPSTYQPTSNSQVVNHTYAGPGRYVAKLLASNDEGQNCTEVFVNVDP